MLGSDAELIGALNSEDYQRTSQRLLSFVDEIGAAAIFLLNSNGRVVAATDRNRLGDNHLNLPHFLEAAETGETVFTTHQKDSGAFEFAYSRKIVINNNSLGFIVVEVDLRKFQISWAGISDAVIVSSSKGSAAANKIASTCLSTELSLLGNFNNLILFFLFIFFFN